jgi:polyhydroxyalkanoate synthesis regulator phasin
VERTIQATVGSAQQTRGRTQAAVDDLVERAEAGAESVRARVRDAIDTTRPATYEDVRELQSEIRALGRRLAAIEERLPAGAGGSGGRAKSGVAKPARPKASARPKQSTASSKTAAARKTAAGRKAAAGRSSTKSRSAASRKSSS